YWASPPPSLWHGERSNRCGEEERHSVGQIAILDHDPAAKDRCVRAPLGKTLLGRHRNQLVYPVAVNSVISDERKRPGTDRQACGQRRRMSQSPCLSDSRIASCQCLVRITKAKQDFPQKYLCCCVGVNSGLKDKRAMIDRIIKRKHVFQMRPR